MATNYNFNAPTHANLCGDDDDENDDQLSLAERIHLYQINSEKGYNTDSSEVDPVYDNAKNEEKDCAMGFSNEDEIEYEAHQELIRNRIKSKTPTLRRTIEVDQSNRQSPRLIAISKAIRRKNADRGLMPAPAKGLRKRSLSEGAHLHFSKVEKKSVRKYERKLEPLTTGCEAILSEITEYIQSSTITNSHNHLSKKNECHYMKETISQKASKQLAETNNNVVKRRDVQSGTTKVQPFKFSDRNKTKDNTAQPFVSLAELNMKFFTKTPTRFRTRSTVVQSHSNEKKVDNKLTVPHTPKLTARTRTRANNHPTREELEEKEIEEAKMHQFKSKPLSKKILEGPNLPVVPTKDPTVPTPFNIIDEQKRAREISESILNKEFRKMIDSSTSLASIPHRGIPLEIRKCRTKVQPFSFDIRDSEAAIKKQEKIEKELEERRKMAEFHAHPMPYFESKNQGVPSPKPLPPTKVQPFHMRSDVFRNSRLQQFEEQVKDIENKDKEKRQFHATEPVSILKDPFVPQLPRRTLDDISGFELNTAKRAEEREQFDMQSKHREDEVQTLKREREERKLKEEEDEIKRWRKDAVHKAQPVRQYKPVHIKHGVLPLTCPKSPAFQSKNKL